MATIHVQGEDGAWRPLGRVRSFASGTRVTFHVAANVPAKVLVRTAGGYALRDDSDDVTVSLADDATWAHMRAMCLPPEHLEGV
jgi:hypothetical protein